MSDAVKGAHSITLLVAVVGVLGAIGGSLAGAYAAGDYALKVQRLQLEQAKLQLSGVNAKAELDTLRNLAADYYFQLIIVAEPVYGNSVEPLGLKFNEEFVTFQKAGSKLLLFSEPGFAHATSRLNLAVGSALQAVGTGEIEAQRAVLSKALQDWVISYHEQAARYRGQALPDDSSDLREMAEALTTFLEATK
jgi:hypothetical protein